MKRKLKKAESDEECQNIVNDIRNRKMMLKKELLTNKNINYHINKNNISEFRKYLIWNKNIHLNGIKKDIAIIILSIICLASPINLIFNISVIALIISILSSIINFECINLQNYNLERLNNYEKRNREKIEERYIKRAKDYDLISTTIKKEFDKTNDIPNPYEILDKINNPVELEQFKQIILETKHNIRYSENNTKIKRKVK